MAGFLVAEEGPLSGLVIRFEEGSEWVLGRDPDVATIVLEDPMVSRKHVICRLTPEGFLLENLSSVNPATQNGKVITEAVLLTEGDIIQIGSTFFRFTTVDPSISDIEEEPEAPEEAPQLFGEGETDLSTASFDLTSDVRWILKVISGPNAGAEFGMHQSATYVMGKDPNVCDIVFQDLSVSRQHARLTVDEEQNVFIEDLGSRNGVLVNGELISDKRQISSQDLVALGTTSFLIIDREQVRETIISPAAIPAAKEEAPLEAAGIAPLPIEQAPPIDWKETIIPIRHLVIAGIFGLLILGTLAAMFSLFRSEPVVIPVKNESQKVQNALKGFDEVQFTYSPANGKLFLVGHVLTSVDKQELIYQLKMLPFVQSIDDHIVVDEYVWQNMNALLLTDPNWQGISIHSPKPGRFVMSGYLQTPEQAQALTDYMNVNFPYLDRLENQVIVENNLQVQVQSMLIQKGFTNVVFQITDGDVVLSGRVDEKKTSQFNDTINVLKALKGVRSVKNFVIFSTAENSLVDITPQYKVTGFSKRDDLAHFVVINGRILAVGDNLDGMSITGIQSNIVFLEKDGLKFKINYNLQ